ncbi:hypothetical protein [Polaromonas sp.]|uniref:hypothetical protein n=1 Tax=Polaromonas sp. TaxID=1869339 RepID=UPI002488DF31|nr:hypothetical protein [Polaromonas sp.]MDI1339490.1 hypothetical protein [Polaromonas sp.]
MAWHAQLHLEIDILKKLALVLAAASLAGCVAVPYGAGQPYYRSHGVPHDGDRDRDSIHNRADRDRDGDGVPNRRDRRPDNPRRYQEVTWL